jgi:hypothetical protein
LHGPIADSRRTIVVPTTKRRELFDHITNGLENFWSLLRRGIKGTYVAVEPTPPPTRQEEKG